MPTAKNVSSAAIRSVPECAASESRPRLSVAIPEISLIAIRTQAATMETSAVRRCGLIGAEGSHATRKARRMAGAFWPGPPSRELSVGDVAVEALLEERPRALAEVVPVVELQVLTSGVVMEVELAVRRVGEARERRARPEERRDEDVGHPAVGRAGRARIERSARDRSAQVPVEAAVDAGIH